LNIELTLSYRINDVLLWNTNLCIDDAVIIGNQLKAENNIIDYKLTNMSSENIHKQHNGDELEKELNMIRLHIETIRKLKRCINT